MLNNTERSIPIYANNSSPYGITYVKWITNWWKWLISIPRHINPALDVTGELCETYQDNQHVWFLSGTFGGVVTRNCKVPLGKAILFPIINCEFSFADEPSIKSEKGLEERCRLEMDKIGDIYATLDGEMIDALKCRVPSGTFTVNMPSDNCLGGLVGETRIASDGFWLFIKPLPRGNHVLKSFGSCLAGKVKIGCTYHLVIK